MYTPIPIKPSYSNITATTLMGPGGVNLRIFEQIVDPKYALKIVNYLVQDQAKLVKRKGISLLFDRTGTDGITMLEKYDDDHYIIGYGTKIDVYELSTETATNIKTYTTSGDHRGTRYGGYFFTTNNTEILGRITRTLDYDGQTGDFTAGLKVTGGTSGATAVILHDDDQGTTGTLTLGQVSGTFIDDEAITDTSTGVAVVNGTLSWAYTTVTGAPTCKIVKAIGSRLYCGGLLEDITAIKYSEVDTGSNHPFTSWTVGTNAGDPGQLNFRNAGEVNEIFGLGNNIVILADDGKWAFRIDVFDSAGTISKKDTPVWDRLDNGGERGVAITKIGAFYTNESGIWQMTSIGQDNVPYSSQEIEVTNILGPDYFKDFDFSQADIVYDRNRDLILVTCQKDASANNHVLVYNLENKSLSTISGWQINRFVDDKGTIYGSGSVSNKVWQVFEGQSDDGNLISTEYYQELRLGDLDTIQALLGQYIQGELSLSSTIDIRFDIYDRTGKFVEDKLKLEWSATGLSGTGYGYGEFGWGEAPWVGDIDVADVVPNFAGYRGRISDFQRIRVRITSSDRVDHTINWLKLIARVKRPARRRNLSDITT